MALKSFNIKSLADFRRVLRTPGLSVLLIENTAAPQPPDHPCWLPTTVAKVQTNSVAFNVAGKKWWIDFGKASEWSFDGDVATNTRERGRIAFRLSLPAEG